MAAKVMVSFPKELLAEVDRIARDEQRSRSELLREAMRVYIEVRRNKSRPGDDPRVRASSETPNSKPETRSPEPETVPHPHPVHFDPVDKQQMRLLSRLSPGGRIRVMLDVRELAVGLIRGRLRRQFPDLPLPEINLKVLEELERANRTSFGSSNECRLERIAGRR